jgi:hypothetical protein
LLIQHGADVEDGKDVSGDEEEVQMVEGSRKEQPNNNRWMHRRDPLLRDSMTRFIPIAAR